MWAKFEQKILNSVVVGPIKGFNFSDKQPGFSEIIELCYNFGIGFCITWIVLSNHKKNQSVKANFE